MTDTTSQAQLSTPSASGEIVDGYRYVTSPRLLAEWLTPLVAVLATLAALIAAYLLPFQVFHDIGTQHMRASGWYPPERNAWFTYAYTTGETYFRSPGAGIGLFNINLHMGGPGGGRPITAWLEAPTHKLRFDNVQSIRVYHVLLPTSSDGDIAFHLRSTTTSVKGDARRLGVFVDWIGIQSIEGSLAPLPWLLSTQLALALLWLGIRGVQAADGTRGVLFALVCLTVCAGLIMFRGRGDPPLWAVIVPGTLILMTNTLARFEKLPLAKGLGTVGALFIVWRIWLWLIGLLGVRYSEQVYQVANGHTYGGAIANRDNLIWNILVRAWMQYDSGHYQGIAFHGYVFEGARYPNIAFFPFYPLLIRLVSPITGGNGLIAALVISHIALFAALLLLYDLVAHDFGRAIACRSLILLLLFPTSVYFIAGYTESLALALVVAAVWAIRRERWWLAGSIGFLFALTRLPGIMITPILMITYLQKHNWNWRSVRVSFLAVLLPPLGLATFMAFQWWKFGTPVAFLLAQRSWGGASDLPWVSAAHLLKAIPNTDLWPIMTLQLAIWAVFVFLSVVAVRRLPLAYSLATVLLLIPPYISNQYGSLPRYVLMAFPAFAVLALLTERLWVRRIVIGSLLTLLSVVVLIFVNGFWVA